MSKHLTVICISFCSLLEVECIRINLAANKQKPANIFVLRIFNIVKKKCCCCSAAKSYLRLCNHMNCSTPGFPVLHCLPEFAHVMYIQIYFRSSTMSRMQDFHDSALQYSKCRLFILSLYCLSVAR